jgi:Arc/MetJ-type ribon-helix-helix transcriptional regulator
MPAKQKPKTGRPEVGPNINVRIPQELVDWIDRQAAGADQRRAQWIRDRLEELRQRALEGERSKEQHREWWREQRERPAPGPDAPRWEHEWAWERAVIGTWFDRHGDAEPYAAVQYAEGVFRHRVGINDNLRVVPELKYDTETKARIRKQVDAILAERGELSR